MEKRALLAFFLGILKINMNKEIFDAFDALEKLYKHSQLFLREFKTSVLNEYRYCARAMVDFHKAETNEEKNEAEQRIKIAISSAYIDILDYLVHSIKETVAKIRGTYWSPNAGKIFKEFKYDDVMEALKKADNLIVESRINRLSRLENYTKFCNEADFLVLSNFAISFSELIHRLECDKGNDFDEANLAKLLRLAINGDSNVKFYLVYQPKFKIEKKSDSTFISKIVGAEALVRLQIDEDGITRTITPDKFLELVSKINMQEKLHELVIDAAIKTIKNWIEKNNLPKNFDLSINISPTLFLNQDFARNIRSIVQLHSVSKYLSLEILEDWSQDNQNIIAHVAYSLNELNSNTTIHIDDFGTGNTKLSYISDIPYIKFLKIDKSIIDGLLSNKRETAKSHIEGIVAFATKNGKFVLAEGVEQDSQIDDLYDVGVEYFQGWNKKFLGAALSVDEFEKKWLVC